MTAEGRILHERVHEQDAESRGDVRVVRGLRLRSLELGLAGVADVVEFHRASAGSAIPGVDGLWRPYPVEYKRGKPKADRCDEVQLCGQAMCLEELRPVLTDRPALSAHKSPAGARGSGFTTTETGGVVMSPETKKTLLVEYQKRKRDEITHSFIEEKLETGLLPFVQARLLARHLRGDLSAYPPFAWK